MCVDVLVDTGSPKGEVVVVVNVVVVVALLLWLLLLNVIVP